MFCVKYCQIIFQVYKIDHEHDKFNKKFLIKRVCPFYCCGFWTSSFYMPENLHQMSCYAKEYAYNTLFLMRWVAGCKHKNLFLSLCTLFTHRDKWIILWQHIFQFKPHVSCLIWKYNNNILSSRLGSIHVLRLYAIYVCR